MLHIYMQLDVICYIERTLILTTPIIHIKKNYVLNCSLIKLTAINLCIMLWTGKYFEGLDRDYYLYQVDHPML